MTITPAAPALTINGSSIPTEAVEAFMLADDRRSTSFITNFGNWQLPPDAAAAFGSPVAHLEWFHVTGELVAFGQVPHLGHGDIEIGSTQSAVDQVGAVFGGAGGRIVRGGDGTVREWFPAMVVGPETLVAVLAVIEHGPRVHELLWGWHLEHRHPEGWAWLCDRLAELA